MSPANSNHVEAIPPSNLTYEHAEHFLNYAAGQLYHAGMTAEHDKVIRVGSGLFLMLDFTKGLKNDFSDDLDKARCKDQAKQNLVMARRAFKDVRNVEKKKEVDEIGREIWGDEAWSAMIKPPEESVRGHCG